MSELLEFIDYVIKHDKTGNYLAEGSLLGFLFFMLYLEISPKLTNIWYRYGADGKRAFMPMGLLSFIKHPLQNKLFWQPENWDLNIYLVSSTVAIGYTALRHFVQSWNKNPYR